MKTFSDFMTVREAAEYLGVATNTLRNWSAKGRVPVVRHPVNGYRLYRKDDLEKLLKELSAKGSKGGR